MMQKPYIEIRRATVEDVAALVRLLRRSWLVSWAPELPFEAVQLFAAVDPAKAHAEAEWASFTVATRDAALLGMNQVDRDTVESLHVDPGAWGLGIGTSLMDEAERRIALSHGTARLEVRAFNQRARGFYRHRGWIEHRRYPGTECGSPVENVEMRKALRP